MKKTDGVVTSTICRDSGKVANSSCPNTFTEYFLKGTVPDMCTQHSGSSMNSNKTNKNNSNSKNTTTNISTPSSKEKNNSSSSTQSTVKTEQNKHLLKPIIKLLQIQTLLLHQVLLKIKHQAIIHHQQILTLKKIIQLIM